MCSLSAATTMRVMVLDTTSRSGEVLVDFPAERIPRGHRTWVPRTFVLDLGGGPPPPAASVAVPPAPAPPAASAAFAPETETPEQIRDRLEAEEEARSIARAQGEAPPLPPLPDDDSDDAEGETERRYEALRAKVRAMGLEVDHCHAEADGCSEGDDDRATPTGFTSGQWRSMAAPDICHCNCEGCRRATACLLQAQREVRRGKRGR